MTVSFYIKFMSKKTYIYISPEILHISNKHEIYIFNSHVIYNLMMNDTKRLVAHEITYFDKLFYLLTFKVIADSGNIIFSRTCMRMHSVSHSVMFDSCNPMDCVASQAPFSM